MSFRGGIALILYAFLDVLKTINNQNNGKQKEFLFNENSIKRDLRMKTQMIYRIEIPESRHGMWYNEHGEFQKTIDILCPNGIAKDFPMPLNLELHRKNGKVWNSAGKSIENMNEWFAPQDAANLLNNGFKLFKFQVDEFQILENEILFTREGIVKQEIIPLEEVWKF